MDVQKINTINEKDLYLAVVSYNADAYIIENDEQATKVLNDIRSSLMKKEVTDIEEYLDSAKKLDFCAPIWPSHIFRFDKCIVAFAEDYGD